MQKMQEQFSVQNGLIFGKPQATQIGLAFFAPLFWPIKKGARTRTRQKLRSSESKGV